jgi:UDP-N-acetylglucosamine--N-acetylmuramyl-(pentapeptide) pyrophosphoryl-undecaprenol N-acetylglucosamine transferase
MSKTNNNIFLLAGRTGGPLIPLLALSANFKDYNPVLIGIRGGFETRVASEQKLPICYLPEAKASFLSFRGKKNILSIISAFLEAILQVFLLLFSFLKSIFLLLHYKPKMILSSGSFLAVPIVNAAWILKKLGFLKTVIVVHQQDPLVGLANRLTVNRGDIVSCVFEYTKKENPKFKEAMLIPNPIDSSRFEKFDPQLIEEVRLKKFLSMDSKKPVFLIFGGGSGAQAINEWVWENLSDLTVDYRVIHLIGALQGLDELQIDQKYKHKDYLGLISLVRDMNQALLAADLVLCRAGLSSITELDYLGKTSFLVPLPNSHQELNASLVKDRFTILEQDKIGQWLPEIKKVAKNKSHRSQSEIKQHQQEISDQIKSYSDLIIQRAQ